MGDCTAFKFEDLKPFMVAHFTLKSMELIINGSNSKGNSYILKSKSGEILLIELGIKFSEIKKSLKFELSKISGAIVTHRHMDHATALIDTIKNGIRVHTVEDTINFFGLKNEFNAIKIEYLKPFFVGSFKIIALKAFHDVECASFIIYHEEMGNVLFSTDTHKLPYKLSVELNNAIIEANYCEDILNSRPDNYLSSRIINSHMSVQQCLKTLLNQNISKVNNIVLIHLSDGNSHEKQFKQLIEAKTGKTVHIADKNMSINFNKTPF